MYSVSCRFPHELLAPRHRIRIIRINVPHISSIIRIKIDILILMGKKLYPPSVQRALRELGRDIQIARKKRRMPVADFAERMGVSQGTLVRLEKGGPGVAIGAVAMALLTLGELRRLGTILDVSSDDTGLMLDVDGLPQRIRKPKSLVLGRKDVVEGKP